MQVIESFVQGKADEPALCEDFIVVTDNFAAVVDGATDTKYRSFDGETGGRLAAQAICKTFRSARPDISLKEFVTDCSKKLVDILANSSADVTSLRERPSAVFVACSASRGEIWRVGDCSWATQEEVFQGRKKIDEMASRTRSALLQSLILQGEDIHKLQANDPGREMILPLLRNQYIFCNNEKTSLGFGAINGAYVPGKFLERWAISPGQDLVMQSDGYPSIAFSLQEAEDNLQKIIAEDPLMIGEHQATKGVELKSLSFDDRAYLRITT